MGIFASLRRWMFGGVGQDRQTPITPPATGPYRVAPKREDEVCVSGAEGEQVEREARRDEERRETARLEAEERRAEQARAERRRENERADAEERERVESIRRDPVTIELERALRDTEQKILELEELQRSLCGYPTSENAVDRLGMGPRKQNPLRRRAKKYYMR